MASLNCGRSGLFYSGTKKEVCLGDRIRLKRWIRSDLYGTVCYIPGISKRHPELEYEDVKKWAIRLDNGTVLAMGYYPDHPRVGQPKKDLELVARNQGNELLPNEKLVEDGYYEEDFYDK